MAPAPKPPFSDRGGNFGARPNEQGAWNAHHPLAGATPGTRGKLVGGGRHVGPDDGKITIRKFKDVRTSAPAGARQCSGRVLQTKSSNKHDWTVILIIYRVNSKR